MQLHTIRHHAARLIGALSRQEGQGQAEYGLILVLIAIVCIIGLLLISGQVFEMLQKVSAGLQGQA
jgi:Flp pilus assembly pilin Flp